MEDKKQRNNWLLDLLILTGFLLSFFLELTGIELHQWIGISLFLLTIIHLANHWKWVKNVVNHFFRKIKPRLRIYALIDGVLQIGFILIIFTGLVISTWFNLNLGDYNTWLNLHIFFSITTLILTVLKIGLHWRWIICVANKLLGKIPTQNAPQSPDRMPRSISRRQFLTMMSVVGLGSALAISNVLPKNKDTQNASAGDNAEDVTGKGNPIDQQQPQTGEVQSQPTKSVTDSATLTESAPTATPQMIQSPTMVCYETCRRGNHCAYPGRCREYIDTNANGLCDLGECS